MAQNPRLDELAGASAGRQRRTNGLTGMRLGATSDKTIAVSLSGV